MEALKRRIKYSDKSPQTVTGPFRVTPAEVAQWRYDAPDLLSEQRSNKWPRIVARWRRWGFSPAQAQDWCRADVKDYDAYLVTAEDRRVNPLTHWLNAQEGGDGVPWLDGIIDEFYRRRTDSLPAPA